MVDIKKEYSFPRSDQDWKNNYSTIPLVDLAFYYRNKTTIFISKNSYFQWTPENHKPETSPEKMLKNVLLDIIKYNTKKILKFSIKNSDFRY